MNPKTIDKQKLFLEMHDSFSDEIFRFCLSKTRNRDEAMDITQETFIKTWDYMRNGNTIDMARGFLYRTARNLIIDYYRKKKPMSLDAMFEESGQEMAASQTVNPGSNYEKEELLTRLKQLPEHHYDVLVLRFIQELTVPEIAAMYKESQNTVSVRIHRALKHAQKLFPEEF